MLNKCGPWNDKTTTYGDVSVYFRAVLETKNLCKKRLVSIW